MNDSLLAAWIAAAPNLSARSAPAPAPITMSKPLGVTSFCSPSSQEPHGMNAALPWHQAACASVWDRASEPGMM